MTIPTTAVGAPPASFPTFPMTPTSGRTPSPATPSTGPDSLGKDAFLKLLVAQLRYQDPLNPAEGAEFIAQTAQFTQVEKLQEVADSTAAALGIQQRWGAGSTVGREVVFLGPDGLPATGTVTAALFGGDEPVLRVRTAGGPTEVPFSSVQELRDPTAALPTPTTPATIPVIPTIPTIPVPPV